MDHDHDDPLFQQHKHQLSTPLLDEPARIKCIKHPLVYLVTLPRTTLLQALSQSDLDDTANQLHIAPSPAYPDILEVRHVHFSQGEKEKEDERRPHPSLPASLAHVQEQDRLTHVNGQLVHSIERLQRRLSHSQIGEKEEMVTVQLLRKLNPYAEYVDMDDSSSSSSSSTSTSSSGDSSSYYYSSSQDDADQDTSFLTMLMTGGGCLSFSPSSSPSLSFSSSSSLTSTSASSSSSSSSNSSRLSTAQDMPLQPYESWGDGASFEHTFYKPLWCFPLFLYLIQEGDSLPFLARSFGLQIAVLRRENRDKFKIGEPAGVLIPGQKLRVRNVEYDGKATAAMVARGGGGEGGGRGRDGGRVGGGLVVRVPRSEKEEEEEEGTCCWADIQKQRQQQQQQQQGRRQHVVGGGETMKGLCARYGVSELDIRRSNRTYFPVGERSVLRENMRLIMFPPAAPAPAAGAAAPGAASNLSVGALWKRKGGAAFPSSSSPRTSSSGSNSSSSSSSSSGSGGEKGGGREGGGDARPVLFPVVDLAGVVQRKEMKKGEEEDKERRRRRWRRDVVLRGEEIPFVDRNEVFKKEGK